MGKKFPYFCAAMLEQVHQMLHRVRDLFFRYGIKSMTMDDIAQQLGMSKKTIYAHFPDKKSLLQALMSDFLNNHHQEMVEAKSQSENAIDEMFRNAALGIQRMDRITPSFLFDLRKYHGEIWNQFEQFRASALFAGITANIHRGMDEGLFRRDLDVDVVAHMHMEHLNLIVDPGHFAELNKPMRTVMYTIMVTFTRGLATPEGMRVLDQLLETNPVFDNSNSTN